MEDCIPTIYFYSDLRTKGNILMTCKKFNKLWNYDNQKEYYKNYKQYESIAKIDLLNLNKIHLSEIKIKSFYNLRHLSLKSITIIHSSIGDITTICNIETLTTLNLSYNSISELPKFNLPNLRSLTLDGNKIKDITNITSLTSLEILNISCNSILELPKNFYILNKLKNISISNNNLKHHYPLELMPSLKLINLRHNAITFSKCCFHNNVSILDISYNNFQHLDYDSFNHTVRIFICHTS